MRTRIVVRCMVVVLTASSAVLTGRVGAQAVVDPATAVQAPPVNASSASANDAAAPAPLGTRGHGVALLRNATQPDSVTPPLPAPANNNKGNTALMLTGVGAVIVGAIVGGTSGTLIILGGAVIGGFGLYRFLAN